nr:hypothetical protein [Tardibacter chloracetimidivorans]
MELAFTVVPSIAANIRPLPRACTDKPKLAAIWCNSAQTRGGLQWLGAIPLRPTYQAFRARDLLHVSRARASPARCRAA